MAANIAERIDAVLPQTQCRQCGYDGCRPYAEAIVAGEAIDRCPPGGGRTLAAIAAIVARPGAWRSDALASPPPLSRAVIDEATCIGCTLCVQACPVDAIVGASKRMHAVLAAACTGCALCLPPCPVDCIAMVPAGRSWSRADADAARARYRRRTDRATQEAPTAALDRPVTPTSEQLRVLSPEELRGAVAAAVARARARRAAAA